MEILRECYVYVRDDFAGTLSETDEGYTFEYEYEYLDKEDSSPVSLTMPLTSSIYLSPTLFSFFDGLIPEGWLLDVVIDNWKINPRDRFGLLMVSCRDGIGNVSIKEKRK